MSELNMCKLEDEDERKRLDPHLNNKLDRHVINKMPFGPEGKFMGEKTNSIRTAQIFDPNVFNNQGFDPTEEILASIDQSLGGKEYVNEDIVEEEAQVVNETPMVNGKSLVELEAELRSRDYVQENFKK